MINKFTQCILRPDGIVDGCCEMRPQGYTWCSECGNQRNCEIHLSKPLWKRIGEEERDAIQDAILSLKAYEIESGRVGSEKDTIKVLRGLIS